MFGASYFGLSAPATVPMTFIGSRTGGGWTHRGSVPMPSRRPTGLPALPTLPSLPSLPKPPYLFYTGDTE
jgi:hypothetical protein